MQCSIMTVVVVSALAGMWLGGCAGRDSMQPDATTSDTIMTPPQPASLPPAAPPANIQAWMDRLTVRHHYDPRTGFIVADEVVALPTPLHGGPSLREAWTQAQREGGTLLVFATADRCGPCQQFKRDALNDPRVVALLSAPGARAVHVEVDRQPEAARELLGSLAIPMTYAVRDGKVIESLRGQRSGEEVLTFAQRHLGTTSR